MKAGVLKLAALAAASAALLLAGCGEEGGRDSRPAAEAAAPTGPGTITVKEGAPEPAAAAGEKFRTYDVRGESRIRYAPEGAEVTEAVKNVQVVVAARNSNPYATVMGSLLSKRLSKEFIVLCSACHDDYGNGVIGPSLIGKDADEVRRMIEKYRGDELANVLMTDLVNRMTAAQVDFIASDLARFNAEIAAEKAAGGKQ